MDSIHCLQGQRMVAREAVVLLMDAGDVEGTVTRNVACGLVCQS